MLFSVEAQKSLNGCLRNVEGTLEGEPCNVDPIFFFHTIYKPNWFSFSCLAQVQRHISYDLEKTIIGTIEPSTNVAVFMCQKRKSSEWLVPADRIRHTGTSIANIGKLREHSYLGVDAEYSRYSRREYLLLVYRDQRKARAVIILLANINKGKS